MTDPVLAARRSYADELRFTTGMRSPALHAAFATVPRERFVGTGPWRIKSPWNLDEYWTTEDADPRHVSGRGRCENGTWVARASGVARPGRWRQ